MHFLKNITEPRYFPPFVSFFFFKKKLFISQVEEIDFLRFLIFFIGAFS